MAAEGGEQIVFRDHAQIDQYLPHALVAIGLQFCGYFQLVLGDHSHFQQNLAQP